MPASSAHRFSWRKILGLLSAVLLAALGLWAWFFLTARTSVAQPAVFAPFAANTSDLFVLVGTSDETEAVKEVALGDYDNDGDLDLAVGNYNQTTSYPLRVYRNDDGAFTMAWASNEVSRTTSIAWGDYDNDGDLDLAAGDDNSGPIRIYRNTNGVLTNSPYYTFASGLAIGQMAWGDVDGDGDLDLTVVETYTSRKQLFLNNNGISFTLSAWTPTPSEYTSYLALADVNGDGKLDVATSAGSTTRIYLNTGSIFTNTSVWTTTVSGGSLAWGDYDGDGDPDLAIGNSYKNIYRNDNGTLTAAPIFTATETNSTGTVAWGDYDGDGDLDLLAGNFSQPARLYRNDDGTLTVTAAWSAPLTESTDRAAWGDFNGDGALDFALAGNIIRFYQNAAGALATKSAWSPTTASQYATDLGWGDYDNDGDLDLAVAYNSGKPAQIFQNVGGGLALTPVWTATTTENSTSLAWGDYDADGWLDLAIGNSGLPSRLYHNNGNGTLSLAWSTPLTDVTYSVAWADVDNDGDLDLAVGNSGTGATGNPNRLYRNDGGGATPTFTLAWSSADNDFTFSVAWGDIDGDGDPDLMAGNFKQPNKLYRNDAGTLTPSAVYSTTESDRTQAVAWGDYDGDGDLDLAVANGDGFLGGQQNRIYRNDNGALTSSAAWSSLEADVTYDIDWGDFDGDGDLDLAAANAQNANLRLYRNTGGELDTRAAWSSSEVVYAFSTAWGDVDGDGDLDLASSDGVVNGKVRLYLNNRDVRFGPAPISILNTARPAPPGNANLFSAGKIWEGASIPLTYTLFDARGTMVKFVRASFSPNGGGQWYTATAASGTVTQNLSTRPTYIYSTTTLVATSGLTTTTVSSPIVIASTPITQLTDLDVLVTISHARVSDLQLVLQAPTGLTTTLMAASTFTGTSLVNTAFDNSGTTTAFSNTISVVGRFRPAGDLAAFNSLTQTQIAGTWNLLVRDTVSGITGTVTGWSLHMQDNTGTHVYYWDPLASGFFGQSDNVIVRLEAVASITNTSNAIAGPYLYGAYAAQTFPFRVRGTQVRVISNTTPVAGAFVYRLPAGDSVGGALVADDSGNPFTTNAQGYLQGRGQLNVGDQLLALYPISATNNYTLYYTNGTPNLVGEDTYTVTTSGVQTLTVSAVTPLYLFDLDVSLEWDASNDAAYQEELLANLQRASEYFYNFTDGQMAFGNVNIWQNADNWGYSHVVVKANNRIRPFAIQGGVVTDTITDTQHSDITYGPGQVTIGSTWNRYGRPGQTIGDDWPLILAHELSHYLLFHDDTYLGLDADGHLKAVSTCKGSAMGDIYNDPLGPNFVFSQTYWLTNCGETLPAQTLGRTEWQTMVLWYPGLVTPSTRLDGPSLMPYDFTRVQINAPLTATTNLIDDPTFYADYANQGVSSNEARAYIVRGNEYVIDLGSPFGGQNRLVAHGAQVGDYLCVFDRPLAQFGCETIALGDDHLQMKQDSAWAPVIQIAPVNSVTLDLHINNLPASLTLRAQLYPEFGYSAAAITLTEFSGVYSGTFTLAEPTNAGHVQVWVANDTPTETNPRRETMVAFSVGGNSGALRAGGGALRAGGGALRAGGGALRAGGGALRAGGAPVTSPDGQMTFFTENPIVFNEGEFYTIQGMAGLPTLPPGRTVIGQGYSLLSTPNTPLITGSVSIQYLSNDVLVAGANEDGLTIYFYDGNAWTALDTTRDAYFNLASAPSQGVGVYALMASVQVPLNAPGWNLFSYPLQESQPVTQALLSISGTYSAVYGFYAEDATHPWKLYATGVPTYVNDLITLDPGRGYWISATQAVTVHFSNLMPVRASLPASPPDTFYGVVQAGPLFTPAAGQTVQARIGGAICGQGATQIYNGQIVYVVDVLADDGVANAGCGQLGRSITFVVNGQIMRPGGAWDNNQLSHLDLSPVALYLPIIRR